MTGHCRESVATCSTPIIADGNQKLKITERGFTIMANEAKGINPVESAEGLLKELKQRAEEAFKRDDQFTFSLMKQLIGVTSPIVTKAVARYHREERARINGLGKEKASQSPNQSGPHATTRLGD
jgi:hypothetical protein